MEFADDGSLYVLEWRQSAAAAHAQYTVKFKDGTDGIVNRMKKASADELKKVTDTNGDGIYDKADVLMDDLEIPSMTLHHDGWTYLPSVGHVIRRKRSQKNGSYDIEEEILRGLCGFHHHQVSGLTISHDGWMYVSSGDDDNRGEGSDGSRATVLRTGAVFRCRPDGSQLTEFARGFRNPYRNVVFDSMYNMFHVDNDNEDGSKYQGCRLMHIVEGADFGWRLLPGAVCCRPDHVRGAYFGERPGKVPAMVKTGRGSPAGLLIYQGTKFPEFFRGLLIYPDVYRKMVRAYRVERAGSTFRVVEQFVLMSSEDGEFRPCQAVVGPDGAIYILDWRTDSGGAGRLWGDAKHGRIYRLSWEGTEEIPAIPLGSIDAWAKIESMNNEQLWEKLDSPDFEMRHRVQRELLHRAKGNKQKFIEFALDESRTLAGRATAIGGASRAFDNQVALAMVTLLSDRSFEIRRLAVEAINLNCSEFVLSPELIAAIIYALKDPHPAVQRSAAITLGRLASLLKPGSPPRQETAATLWVALTNVNSGDAYLRDGIIRGLERTREDGIELLKTKVLSKNENDRELAIATFEALRTREAANGLDAILASDTSQITDQQMARLLASYRHILVEPAISTDAVTQWLAKHPDAGIDSQISGLETIGLTGGTGSKVLASLANKLLTHENADARLSAIQAIGNSGLNSAAKQLAVAIQDEKRSVRERREIITALGKLRSRRLPFNNEMTPPGVEAVTDELLAVAENNKQGEIRSDALLLLSQVDYKKAEPVALELLKSEDSVAVAAAINSLGSNPVRAKEIAHQFLAGKIGRNMLPRVAEVIQRHTLKDNNQEFDKLLTEVFKGGLLISLEPAEVQRVTKMVAETGDPKRGRQVFLDRKRTQCVNCHTLEGIGGQVGPNLSKIWQTHTVSKVMESLLNPSKEIKEGFFTWTVVMNDGKVFSGLKVSETKRQIVLRDSTGKNIRLLSQDIDERIQTKKSLMPDGLITQLSYQEFVDLVAFLKDREAQLELKNIQN